MRRALVPLLAVATCFMAMTAASLDARARRAERDASTTVIRDTTKLLPWPDFALAGGARHLRFITLEEPGAAFADLPASLDADPAGGAIAPPVAVWTDEARGRGDLEIRRGH